MSATVAAGGPVFEGDTAGITPGPPLDRRLAPLLDSNEHPAPSRATALTVEPFDAATLVKYNAAWHSRLPHVQLDKLLRAVGDALTASGAIRN